MRGCGRGEEWREGRESQTWAAGEVGDEHPLPLPRDRKAGSSIAYVRTHYRVAGVGKDDRKVAVVSRKTHSSLASSTLLAMGLSHMTSFPASSEEITTPFRMLYGAETSTKRMPGLSTAFCSSEYGTWQRHEKEGGESHACVSTSAANQSECDSNSPRGS
eukprot:82268-Rhodomonas_salina.2